VRVVEIKTYQMWGEPRNWIFVKLLTDEGIPGWGEGTVEGKEDTIRTAIDEVGAYLIGKDPTAVEHHWQAMLRHGFWRGGVILTSALAEAYYVQVAPHSPQGPVSTAACAHLALSIPNFHILEHVRSEPWRDRVLREPWPVERGFLAVPERPGLGVELDEDAIAASPPRPVGVPVGAWHADGSVADV
jgi:L-alanine-DL-glutamate epimerase-like enolase superfamily enzyme